MDNRILLGGAAVLVVGAAVAGGYYMGRPSTPAPAPVTQPAPPPPEAPVQMAAPAAPATESAAPPPSTPVAAQPVQKKRRLPDYASGENAYGPPPPPPPPPRGFNGPNPFEERFSTFPMRHSGEGTLASPLTWSAQTQIGRGHEADLRVSVVVPTPPPGDNGVFWSRWGSRGADDVMPEITRGTPVVVAASASVVVAIDPEFLDLDAPAVLSVNGRDGQRIYRSRDVAPARGESWNGEGARWIFQPDADFFRLMRDGADISVSFRSRASGNPVTVPFSADDFPPTLNDFEHDLYRRMPGIAAAWERSRPGAPPPLPPRQAGSPPPPNTPPQYGPQPNGPFGGPGNPPPRGPAPPQYGPQPSNGWQQSQSGPQNGWHHGQRPQGSPQQQASVPPSSPPSSPLPAQPSPQGGNGYDHGPGDHTHDHGAAGNASAQPIAPNPNIAAPSAKPVPANVPPPKPSPVQTPMTPPAKPVLPAKPVAPPPPAKAAVNPGAAMFTAEVAAYRPPTDNCGPPPPMPQGAGPSPERKEAKVWFQCRTRWMTEYKISINVLNRDASRQRVALEGVRGGTAITANFEKAQSEFNAQKAIIKP
jgi:hypothetical protein